MRCIDVSDNESWVDVGSAGRETDTMRQCSEFKRRSPDARLVCIDIQPHATTQAKEREDILNLGGFSDQVFQVIADFAGGALAPGHWVRKIEEIEI